MMIISVYTDGIVSTMSKQAGPSAVKVTSADQLKAKLEKYNDYCIVGECARICLHHYLGKKKLCIIICSLLLRISVNSHFTTFSIPPGFFSDGGNKVAKAFQKVADKERESFKFVFTVDADTATEYGYNE